MTKQEIIQKAESFGKWYHAIPLIDGYVTKSVMKDSCSEIWNMIREVRKDIQYHDKTVLDLGTMDGMWAFESEALGARQVFASDIWQAAPSGEARLGFAICAKDSLVIKVAGLDVQREIHQRVDIVQCLGLLYHVEHPLLALQNIRESCRGGMMLLETAMWNNGLAEPMIRMNSDSGIYCDPTTFFAPNFTALMELLKMAGFTPMKETTQTVQMDQLISRICLICQ